MRKPPGQHPTLIGRVVGIVGSTISIQLEDDLAGISPTWNGQLHSIGQIGTPVSLPQGASSLLASVTRVSLAKVDDESESSTEQIDTHSLTHDRRMLEAQLLGEIDGLGQFRRGVSSYPSIDDPVHFVSGNDLVAIYPSDANKDLNVGTLSANNSIHVSLALQPLVMRHSVVVGSTGSGKSSAVSRILQGILQGPWASSRIIIIDTHGEYKNAFPSEQHINLATLDAPFLPGWILPARDILSVMLRGAPSSSLVAKFEALVTSARQEFAATASWVDLEPEAINADSPIPFDMNSVWYELDKANRRTCKDKEKTIDALVAEGDPRELRSASFTPYGPTATEPFKGPENSTFGTQPDQLRKAIQDPRLAFFSSGAFDDHIKSDPLPDIVNTILGNTSRISIIDTSEVASAAAEVCVGGILQLAFELAIRGGESSLGRAHPVLLVIEEAHRYFGSRSSNRVASMYVDRISREGRKYGIGLMLVSQRPSELPATAMSQVGTVIALRLNNDTDKASVSSTLPDSVSGLADSLPSLRTGEAIIAGEALPLPSRVTLGRPYPEPTSDDPNISAWLSRPQASLDLSEAIKVWRRNS
ncbi:ATP-binding protein [Clavibacter michiganensis subsp. michiganensis]|uniref:ATP-binding protein n=1 Tax=Clavibacter michiganensis TaxID=28447 RepID=UPI001C65017A|nr:ATP-binding protein [Clavibacter michiganensis]MBW8027764.1 ATP-binding protein [Clavibacter michiganensis subsp. michiganensis]